MIELMSHFIFNKLSIMKLIFTGQMPSDVDGIFEYAMDLHALNADVNLTPQEKAQKERWIKTGREKRENTPMSMYVYSRDAIF